MSTKTFPYNPFGNGDNPLIFLVISVFLHIVLALGIISFKPVLSRLAPKEKEPVVVDVVELSSGSAEPAPPKKFTHFAERNQSVDKETYPEPSKPALRSIPAPMTGSKGGGKEASAGVRGHKGEVKKSAGSPVKEAATAVKKEDTVKTAGKTPPKASLADKNNDDTYKSVAKVEKPVKEAAPKEMSRVDTAEERPDRAAPSKENNGGAKSSVATKPGRPNLFPTSERLSELEKKYEAAAPKGEKGKTLQLNTSELRYQKYLMNMKNRIEFYWEYPDIAARSGWQGVLNINFTINKDGTVSNITVAKSSNYPVLDDAAVTAIRLAAPFPPFPDNFGIEEINIKGQFEYKIYGGPQGG